MKGDHPPGGMFDPVFKIDIFDDFLWATDGVPTNDDRGPFGLLPIITGGTTGAASGEQNRPGVMNLLSAALATDRAAIVSHSAAIHLGGGIYRYETAVRVITLSTAAEEFVIHVGFGDQAGAGAQIDGVYFKYDRTVSVNWLRCASSNSVATETATSQAVSAGSWITLSFEVNAAGTSVEYFANRTSLGTIVTNIPTGAGRQTGLIWKIQKTVGTGSRIFSVDWARLQVEFTTPRS